MILNIETTPEKYFHQLVEIFKVFAPFNRLRKRQREVFAEILYYNHKFSGDDETITNRLVFDFKTREEISIKLGISKANLYNIYKELRQEGLLLKDKDEINPTVKYKYMQYPKIEFKFKPKGNIQQAV